MSRFRYLFTSLIVVGLVLLVIGTTFASPRKGASPGKGGAHKARVTWSLKRVSQTLSPGQTTQVGVTLTSNVELTNVTVRVPGNLGKAVQLAPSSFASLKAGSATPVTLSISMPVQGASNLSGVVQVRAGKGRTVPSVLPVKLKLAGATPESEPAP